MRAYLGLGSNLGDRRRFLSDAIASLPGVVAVSDVYETGPVGGPDQGAFLNLVVQVEVDLTPRQLLVATQDLEREAERERIEHWGPRTLDIDILWTDTGPVDDPDLEVPHPRMNERRFVLAPLAELAPELTPPGWEDEAVGEVRRLGPL